MSLRIFTALLTVAALAAGASAADLEVGTGRQFSRIEDALAKARPGDTILVYPLADGKAYSKPAVMVRTAGLTIRSAKAGARVKLDGSGYDYSGVGPTPRAIFQFDPGADGCILDGFELFNAHNDSANGAGVRINQANDVTIRNCTIRDNDMGIMSNGELSAASGANQRIEFCTIHSNGNAKRAGYNHNLYLGGTSVTLHGCEVYASLTGHNVKSRAHFNWIEYCYIHDSANREFDLVDDKGNTEAAGSHSVLLGNLIVKAADMKGNKTVVHFGQDGGNDHKGAVYLVHNTIVTPYLSAVVHLSAPSARAELVANIICGKGNQQTLADATNRADIRNVSASGNWIGAGFSLPAGAAAGNVIGGRNEQPAFADAKAGDYHPRRSGPKGIIGGAPGLDKIKLPPLPKGKAAATRPATRPATTPATSASTHPAGRIETLREYSLKPPLPLRKDAATVGAFDPATE